MISQITNWKITCSTTLLRTDWMPLCESYEDVLRVSSNDFWTTVNNSVVTNYLLPNIASCATRLSRLRHDLLFYDSYVWQARHCWQVLLLPLSTLCCGSLTPLSRPYRYIVLFIIPLFFEKRLFGGAKSGLWFVVGWIILGCNSVERFSFSNAGTYLKDHLTIVYTTVSSHFMSKTIEGHQCFEGVLDAGA